MLGTKSLVKDFPNAIIGSVHHHTRLCTEYSMLSSKGDFSKNFVLATLIWGGIRFTAQL